MARKFLVRLSSPNSLWLKLLTCSLGASTHQVLGLTLQEPQHLGEPMTGFWRRLSKRPQMPHWLINPIWHSVSPADDRPWKGCDHLNIIISIQAYQKIKAQWKTGRGKTGLFLPLGTQHQSHTELGSVTVILYQTSMWSIVVRKLSPKLPHINAWRLLVWWCMCSARQQFHMRPSPPRSRGCDLRETGVRKANRTQQLLSFQIDLVCLH